MRPAVVLLFILLPLCAHGQTFGLTGLYRFGTLASVDRERGAINQFNTNGAGTSLEQVFAVGPYYELGVLPSLAIHTSVFAGAVTGSFVSDSYLSFDSTALKHFEVNTSSTLLELAASPTYRVHSLQLSIGPIFDLFMARSRTVREIGEGGTARPADTSLAATSPVVGRFAFGMSLGIELPVAARPTISATLRYDPYVNRFRSLGDALQTGVTVSVPFSPQQIEPLAPDSSSSIVQAPAFAVRIGDRNIEHESVLPVSVEYTVWQQYEELPRILEPDWLQFLSPTQVSQFSEATISPGEDLRTNVLNVIASRLRALPAAKIELHGGAAAVHRIEQYLTEVWKLSNPIAMDAKDAKGAVVIASNDAQLLLPLSRRVIEKRVTIPPIVIEAGSELAPYELVIASDGDTLLRKTGSGADGDNSVTMLPANIDLHRPLSLIVTRGAQVISRQLQLQETGSDTLSSRIEVTFHPSLGDGIVQSTRKLLLERLESGRLISLKLLGSPDAEASSLLHQLGSTNNPGEGESANWQITVAKEVAAGR